MKAGWKAKPLGEVCEILDRLRKPITKSDRKPGPYPYYGATGVLDHVHDFLFDEPLVLLGEDGAKWEAGANSAFIIKGKTWVNNHAHVLKPNRSLLNDAWLVYYLNMSDLLPFVSGLTVPKLNQGRLREIPIPLPPLEEQRRIVAILDETFEGLSRARANAEANLQSARELFESYSGAVFSGGEHGWRSFPLEALVDPDCTLSYGIVQPGDEVAGGMPIVRPTDLGSRIIGLDGLKRIDPARASGYARTELKGGDLLLCVRGTTGTVSMAAPELRSANVTRGIVPIRFRADLVDQRLGYFILRSLPVQTQIRAATYGAALMQINIRDVRQIAISVPPRSQQAELVDQLEQAENDFGQLENAYVRQIDDLDQLRQSLLQKAFSGELTVKEFA